MVNKFWYTIAAFCLICMLAGPAAALSITTLNASGMNVSGLTNNTLMNGENITVNVSGMTNGTSFQWNVTSHQKMSSFIGTSNNSNTSAFYSSNITVPFKVSNPIFNISNANTTENSVVVGEYESDPVEIAEEGLYHELVFNGTSVNGLFSRSHKGDNIEGGTMITRWIATPMPGAAYVTSAFDLNGTKVAGPDTFDLNTSVYSANPATIDVTIMANGTLAYNETFSIIQNTTLLSSSASESDPLTGWLTSFWQFVSGQ